METNEIEYKLRSDEYDDSDNEITIQRKYRVDLADVHFFDFYKQILTEKFQEVFKTLEYRMIFNVHSAEKKDYFKLPEILRITLQNYCSIDIYQAAEVENTSKLKLGTIRTVCNYSILNLISSNVELYEYYKKELSDNNLFGPIFICKQLEVEIINIVKKTNFLKLARKIKDFFYL